MVLSGIDRALEIGCWLTAAVLALMLFIGPEVVAEDKPLKSGGPGQKVFTDNCGSCHTLSRAGTNGQVGPNLDNVNLKPADVEAIVRSGSGAMPSFQGKLSDQEIADVAKFVAGPSYTTAGR
jgi:mono/diheme cytochrome c family protein